MATESKKKGVRFGGDTDQVLTTTKFYEPGWNPTENVTHEITSEWVKPPTQLETVATSLFDPLEESHREFVADTRKQEVQSTRSIPYIPANLPGGGTTLGIPTGYSYNKRGVLRQTSQGIPQSLVPGIEALPYTHAKILEGQVAVNQAQQGVTLGETPYELGMDQPSSYIPSYKKPTPILKTSPKPVNLSSVRPSVQDVERAYVEAPVDSESGIPAMLSRLLMNVNRDPNTTYTRFNRNVRPFVKNPRAASVKARRRGFFTSESKNSYRRTLKAQLNELLRNVGATYTADAALTGIHAMAMDKAVSTAAVYERMKEWISQYAMRNLSTVGTVMPIDPKINGVANLFRDLTPSSSRGDLQHAADLALLIMNESQPAVSTDITPLLAELRVLKDRSKGKTAVDFYQMYTQILQNYAAIIATLPVDVANKIRSVKKPAARGFFTRVTGTSNTNEWALIYGKVLDAIAALERIPVPTTTPRESPTEEIQSVNLTTQIYKVIAGIGGETTYYRVLKENNQITNVIQIPATNVDRPVINATEDELRTMINKTVASQRDQSSQGFLPVTVRRRKPLGLLPGSQPKLGDQWAAIPGQGGGSRKTSCRSRKMRSNRTRKQKQHGGAATSMPLAWYQPGAQIQGTVADPTGVGLSGSSASWARSALPAQGGGSRSRKTRRQLGGFSPSVMGAGFASVGMRLLPAAAYMGYNQFNNYRKQKKRTYRKSRK